MMSKLVIALLALGVGLSAREKKFYNLDSADAAKGKQLWAQKEKAQQEFDSWKRSMSVKYTDRKAYKDADRLSDGTPLYYVYHCYADLDFSEDFTMAITINSQIDQYCGVKTFNGEITWKENRTIQ